MEKEKTNKNLILLGAGGHCKSVIDVAESAGYTILAILGTSKEIGKEILGYKVSGTDKDILKFIDKALFIITVGQITNADIRKRLYGKIMDAKGKLGTLISPLAYISKYAQIGVGTVVMPNAFVNANAIIGQNCIINSGVIIEHDVTVADFCHISTGTILNGDCTVGENTFIGSGSTLINGVSIGNNVVVGAGSVIIDHITTSGLYVGNPAELKKQYKA